MAVVAQRDVETGVYDVALRDGEITRSVEFGDAIVVDVDSQGRALGIEVFDYDYRSLAEAAVELGFVDDFGAVISALAEAGMGPRVTSGRTAGSTGTVVMTGRCGESAAAKVHLFTSE